MLRAALVRLGICLVLAGATIPTFAVGPAHAQFAEPGDVTGPQTPATPTAEPTPEIPDTLGPSTDDEGDGGLGGGAAAGLGIAAAALVAGGFVLRRYGRN